MGTWWSLTEAQRARRVESLKRARAARSAKALQKKRDAEAKRVADEKAAAKGSEWKISLWDRLTR